MSDFSTIIPEEHFNELKEEWEISKFNGNENNVNNFISLIDKMCRNIQDGTFIVPDDEAFVQQSFEIAKTLGFIDDRFIKEEIKKLSDDAIIPKRGTIHAACKDLYSPIDCVVPAKSNKLIKTNIAIAWSNSKYYIQLLSRSGLAYKNNVVVQAGVIDIDYRDNIGVLLQNNSDVDFVVKRGDRIAQYAYVRINNEESEVVDEFTISLDSDRDGGFGSTGR
jgi:dUTP pyrophosphatase